jgi:hypothetical protein
VVEIIYLREWPVKAGFVSCSNQAITRFDRRSMSAMAICRQLTLTVLQPQAPDLSMVTTRPEPDQFIRGLGVTTTATSRSCPLQAH